jgi:hypothetical protein
MTVGTTTNHFASTLTALGDLGVYCCSAAGAGGRKYGPMRAPALKGSHSYSSGWYAWLLLSNLLLRFTWAHRCAADIAVFSFARVDKMTVSILVAVLRVRLLGALEAEPELSLGYTSLSRLH